MSDPIRNYDSPIYGALHELMSASSSLHMGFEERDDIEDRDFLDEVYVYVAHAREHIHAAVECIGKASTERYNLKMRLIKSLESEDIHSEIEKIIESMEV